VLNALVSKVCNAQSSRHQLWKNKPNINNWKLSIYCKSFRGICRRVCFYVFTVI